MQFLSQQKVDIQAIIVLVFIGIILSFLAEKDLSWTSVAYDAPNYLIAAEELRLSHPSPGAPLYNIVNALIVKIPFPGLTNYAKLTLVSIVASAAVALVLYLYTKKILAPLLWISIPLVISQSIVLEVYTLITLIILSSYILWERDNRTWSYIVLGLGIAIHHLALIPLAVFIAKDIYDKKDWKPILGFLTFLPFLLYIPLVNREPYLWINGDSLSAYYKYFFSQGGLTGGLAIIPSSDLLERIPEVILLVLASFGISILLYLSTVTKEQLKNDIVPILLIILPITYYATNLAPQVYTYVIIAVPFGIILACRSEIGWMYRLAVVATIFIICLNAYFFNTFKDTAAIDFYNSLNDVEPNAIIWSENRGWEKTTVELFNQRNSTNIGTVNLRKPIKPIQQIEQELLDAQTGKKLYHTIVVDKATKEVSIRPTTTTHIMNDLERMKWVK
jgi:hypothetical protein